MGKVQVAGSNIDIKSWDSERFHHLLIDGVRTLIAGPTAQQRLVIYVLSYSGKTVGSYKGYRDSYKRRILLKEKQP